jgi:single-stranded DNA-binding protein
MNSIECALVGRLARDVEIRTSQSGRPWARATVGVGSGDSTTWLNIALFGALCTDDLVGQLKKGTSVYIEGRDLGIDRYTTQSGEERVGLNAIATKVEVLGLIGRNKPPEGFDPALVSAQSCGEPTRPVADWQRPLREDTIPFAPAR